MTGNQIAYWKYAEDVRHNAETESQGRTNLAEVRRHNLASEGLQARQIGLGYAQLAETKRANTARELLQSKELAETTRRNSITAIEIERSNKAKEEETNRANQAKEEETKRHNEKQEAIDQARVNLDVAKHNFDVGYKTRVETWLRVGEALTGLISSGAKIATIHS